MSRWTNPGGFVKPSVVVDPVSDSTSLPLDETKKQPLMRGRAGAALGLASAALLVASFRWAHHWGPLSSGIVAAWSLTTIAALAVSAWSLDTTRASRRFAMAGLALALVSLLAVALVGVLYAAGTDVSDACGGG